MENWLSPVNSAHRTKLMRRKSPAIRTRTWSPSPWVLGLSTETVRIGSGRGLHRMARSWTQPVKCPPPLNWRLWPKLIAAHQFRRKLQQAANRSSNNEIGRYPPNRPKGRAGSHALHSQKPARPPFLPLAACKSDVPALPLAVPSWNAPLMRQLG